MRVTTNKSVNLLRSGLVAFGLVCFGAQVALSGTLDTVKKRGKLECGVSEGLLGFSARDEAGNWSGFDVDFCRAVAAAVFGNADKVDYVPLSAVKRFDALSSGKIDLLSRNTTWTMSRDVERGLEFVGITYFDGQGFMTRRENGLSSALQLGSAKICALSGTTSEANARAYFSQNKVDVEIVTFPKREDALKAYADRKCDVYSADRSALASERSKLEDSADHMLLPEVASKEPLGPVVRQDDHAWLELNRWVLFLLINAEEAGWQSTTKGDAPIVVPAEVSAKLGLPKGWAADVIKSVGNYGEIFARNVGRDTPLGLGRGLNALWTRGGLIYAPPMR